jgi:RNA recognition motif-containing protein
MVRLFVGGLPNDVTEAQLKERFKAFGHVTSVTLPPPKSAGSRDPGGLEAHRGFAYLELTAEDASAVRRCLNAVRQRVLNVHGEGSCHKAH